MVYIAILATLMVMAGKLDYQIAIVVWMTAAVSIAYAMKVARDAERRLGNEVPHWRFWR